MHLKCLILLISIFFITSCHQDAPTYHDYNKTLTEKETIRLQLDNITPIDNTYFTFERLNDTAFIFLTNVVYNSIDVYLRANGAFYKRFKFDREGPESIPQLQDYTVVNEDSFFVFSKFHIVHTRLINWNGTCKNTQPIPLKVAHAHPVINHLSGSGGATYFIENSLFFMTFPLIDAKLPESYNASVKFEYCYDLINDSLILLPLTYPKHYHNKTQNRFVANPYRDKGEDLQFVYSWPKEPYLLQYDGKKQRFYVHDAHDTRISPLFSSNIAYQPESEKELKNTLEHAFYMRILYDKYRKLYYRVALLPIAFDKKRHTSYMANFERPFAIIVLDEAFQAIAFRKFPANLYNHYSLFVGADGLYIAKNNPNRKELHEEILELTVFAVQ